MTPEALIIESMFNVVDKDKNEIPFLLNSAQRKLDENLTGRDIVPKARQEGVSTYVLARYAVKCLTQRNTQAVIISHESEATQRLLSRCRYFLETIRGPKPVVDRDSANIITFPKMNSKIFIGTAGSRKFGRGDTITNLHCSELAYWPDPKELLNGLMEAVPMSGEVVIESTGNGVGNYYHRMCVRAYEKKSHWSCHFLNWHEFDEYTLHLSPEDEKQICDEIADLKMRIEAGKAKDEFEEVKMLYDIGLTPGQIAWRRMKLDDKDYDLRLFKQEYPLTFDECFQASGDSIFHRIRFVPTEEWKDQGNNLSILYPHPIEGHVYVVGADPSGGTGNDNACAEVIDITTMEQVAEYAYNRIEPDTFGDRVTELARLFNNAFIVVEANNHGPVTLKQIRENDYPSYLIYSMGHGAVAYEDKTLMKMGFRTNVRTKPLMIGQLRTAVAHDLTIHSPLLHGEMGTFIEHENGKLAAAEGCMDDRVMAIACAVMGIERAGIYAAPASPLSIQGKRADPFTLDAIIEEREGGRNKFPFKPQVSTHPGGF